MVERYTTTDNISVTFNGNSAYGYFGIVEYYILTNCLVIFKGSSMVTFQNNNAKSSGGAVYLKDNSLVVSKEYPVLHFKQFSWRETWSNALWEEF